MLRDATHVLLMLALPVGLPFIGLTVASAWLLRRRRRDEPATTPWVVAIGVCASLALIVAATVFRDLPPLVLGLIQDSGTGDDGRLGSRFAWSANGWQRLTYETTSTQSTLNALLFLPAGAFLTLFTRRPWRVTFVLGVLSLAVEYLQGILRLGAPDVADLAMNTAGGAVGAVVGTVMLWAVPRLGDGARPSRRHMVLRSGLVATLCLALVGVGLVGADRRQATLVDEAHATFGGTTTRDVTSWGDADRLEEEAFSLGGTRADGVQYAADSVLIRYPASFLSLRRCVLVEWTADRAQVRRGSGDTCSRFLG